MSGRINRYGDLIAGFHVKKPGIEYKINIRGVAILHGVSNGEPHLFGDVYCAEKNNEVYMKNALPLTPLEYRLITIEVSEPVDVEFYHMYLELHSRKSVITMNLNLELDGKKYLIKSSEIYAAEE